tara:strand:- start:301 stop:720 length:420 start_codon:yes stop_codon:yes gene_type:complete
MTPDDDGTFPNDDSTFLEPRDIPTAWAYLVLNDYKGPFKQDGSRLNIHADEGMKMVGFDPKTGNGTWQGIAPEYRWDHMARRNCCNERAVPPLPNYCGRCATGIGAETWKLGQGEADMDPALAAEIDALFNAPVEEPSL